MQTTVGIIRSHIRCYKHCFYTCYSHRNFTPLQESIGISHLYKECQEESQVTRDESKDHSAVDESSSEQQIRESADYTLIVRKNWSPSPSATGSYGRQVGRQAGRP